MTQSVAPAVSIVIIVQDDEARIGEAIASARNQGLENVEILVVDHGSTDGTAAVAHAQAAADPRVRVIELGHRRGRPGTPINAGLAAARAPWATVVGSDDELLPGGVERMLTLAEQHDAQLVVGGIEAYDMETNASRRWAAHVITRDMVLDGIDEYPELVADTTGAGKLYNLDFVRRHGFEFPPDIYFQDQVFTLRYYATAPRIVVTTGYVYRWRAWPTAKRKSVTKSRHTLANLQDRVTANTLIDDYLTEHPHPEVQRAVREKFLRHDLTLYAIGLGRDRDDEYRAEFMERMGGYLRRFPDDVVQGAPFVPRLFVGAIAANRLDAVLDLAEHRAGEAFWAVERRDLDGVRYAVLPSWQSDSGVEPVLVDVSDLHEDLIPAGAMRTLARLEHVEQVGKHELHLGFALLCGPGTPDLANPMMRAVNCRSGEWVSFSARTVASGEHRLVTVEVPLSELPVLRTVGQRIRLELGTCADDGEWLPVSAMAPKNPTDPTVTLPGMLAYGNRFRIRSGENAIVLTQVDPPALNRRGVWRLNRIRKQRLTDRSVTRLPARELARAYEDLGSPAAGAPGSEFQPRSVTAVLFESFFGSQVADAPLYLSRALHELRPEVVQFWSFEPGSNCAFVPDWAVPVPRSTRRYAQALATSQVWVDNGWISSALDPGTTRYYLQAFHGIPLKHLGKDFTAGAQGSAEAVEAATAEALRTASRWTAGPTSGEYYSRTFGGAFGMTGRLLQTGSPRTDPLVSATAAERRAELRRRWSVGDRKVVLYAPTVRREPISPSYRPPSVRALADLLGPDFFWLNRSHYRDGASAPDDRLNWFTADVSDHPSIADLILVSDVLVSDFSSVIFDFAQTGRPVVGFATDTDFYENVFPGVYEPVARVLGADPCTDEAALAAALTAAVSDSAGSSAQAGRIVAEYAELDARVSAELVWRELGLIT